jgi:hypothetical protein
MGLIIQYTEEQTPSITHLIQLHFPFKGPEHKGGVHSYQGRAYHGNREQDLHGFFGSCCIVYRDAVLLVGGGLQ